MKILTVDELLKTPARLATKKDLKRVLPLMLETLYEYRESIVGLAAPQIGEDVRVVVCLLSTGCVYMVNPVITDRAGEFVSTEQCMSLPGETYEVPRPEEILVLYQGAKYMETRMHYTPKRCTKVQNYEEMRQMRSTVRKDIAIICHEVDHLEGRTIADVGTGLLNEALSIGVQIK